MPGIDGLRAALEALPLRIDRIRVHSTAVPLRDYGEEPRPTSTVVVSGGGASGFGEHVGWTASAHAAFRDRMARLACGAWTLGEWAATLHGLEAYDRAALEAASIDLALRQQRTSLLELAGLAPRDVRYVASFARSADPLREAAAAGNVELKVDADPAWPLAVWKGLAAHGRVAVVDFKLGGEPRDHELACELLPGAWIEDPKPSAATWSPRVLARRSADADVTSVEALRSMSPLPAAVNVKAPRMGGVLQAISCLELCADFGIPAYIGGMFEVGIARRQSLVLATVACAEAPNDIAPLRGGAGRPARLAADPAWSGFAGDPPQ